MNASLQISPFSGTVLKLLFTQAFMQRFFAMVKTVLEPGAVIIVYIAASQCLYHLL